MANSIVQTRRHGTAESGSLKTAQSGDPRELSRLYGNSLLSRAPDYRVDALTDDGVIFTAWDSSDPLNNTNATSEGYASPALVFPANTHTPVIAKVTVANDDTIGWITLACLVKGSATAPTLVEAFTNVHTLGATFSSGTASRVAARSTPDFTITGTPAATGRYTVALTAAASGHIVCGCDSAAATVNTAALHAQPNGYVASTGAGEIRFYGAATPALTAPGDTHILHAVATVKQTTGYLDRYTQENADTADCTAVFSINTSPTPDSLRLRVTGITAAELRWNCMIWIGDPLPVAFRTQV
jgi:hypothetical protein